MSDVDRLATIVHGAGAAFDGLGVYWHWKRRKWLWFGLSLAGFVFHVISAFDHYTESLEETE